MPPDRSRAERTPAAVAEPPSGAVASGTAGHARALTVLSPLPRIWSPLLRVLLWRKRKQGPDPDLQRLSLIHVADWVVIDRFPLERRPARYAYLLFVSNFNGSWREYIDAFSTAIPLRMAAIWGTSFGFPGPRPPVPFVRYIEANQLAPEHYWSAYPDASATDVAAALRVADAWQERVAPAAGADDAALARAVRDVVDAAQRDL